MASLPLESTNECGTIGKQVISGHFLAANSSIGDGERARRAGSDEPESDLMDCSRSIWKVVLCDGDKAVGAFSVQE